MRVFAKRNILRQGGQHYTLDRVEPAALYGDTYLGRACATRDSLLAMGTICTEVTEECHRHKNISFMALITISGLPSSGKSTRAAQIQNFILNKSPLSNVIIISDHSLGLSPDEYNQSSSEKSARATLFAAVQRHMAIDTILIVDSLNYIKGFRYQLFCAARQLKLRTCTVRHHFSPSYQNQPSIERYLLLQVQIYAENGMRLGKLAADTTQPRTSTLYSYLPYSYCIALRTFL